MIDNSINGSVEQDLISDTIIEKQSEPIQEEQPTVQEPETVSEPEVVDVDLGIVDKKRFRIDGDYNRMLELNVSDLNIANRLKVGYPKLQKLLKEAQDKVKSIPDSEDRVELLNNLADRLSEIDKEMRDIIDEIFDTNASEICAPVGTMYDPVGGQFRFERIIEKLAALYTNGLSSEFNKMKNRVEKRASKYTKKYHN